MGTELDLSGLKSPLFKDDLSTPADITGSTVQCSRSSAREGDRICPGMEDYPQSTTKSLPLDLAFQSTGAPAEQEPPVGAVKEDRNSRVHHTHPVCTQLSASTQPQGSLCPTSKSYRFQHHRQSQELHSCTSESNTPHSLQTTHRRQVAGDDPCASLVLACLFCQLQDCLIAMGDGCQVCVGGLCSALCSRACCCDPSSLESFLEVCPCCEPTSCLHAHCCLCRGAGVDTSICDLCIHATECLELGMEISQLLFH